MRLTAQLLPAPKAAVSKQQYLSGSDGTHWVPLDANGLSVTIAPTVSGTAVLRVSADLWTTASRDNQDFGVFASVNGGAETLVGWKESGGWGTYSPNASFAQATYRVGQSPLLTLVVTNTGPVACKREVTRRLRELIVFTADSLAHHRRRQLYLGFGSRRRRSQQPIRNPCRGLPWGSVRQEPGTFPGTHNREPR